MSEDKGAGGTDDQASGSVEKTEDKVAFTTYSKVLSEKKKRDAEVAELKAQLDSISQKEMEAQGKFKEMNDQLKKQVAEKDSKLKNMFQEFGTKTLKGSFQAEAKGAGCVDPDALYKLVDLSTVEIGDDFSFNSDQLKGLISESQKSRPYLFKKDVVNHKDATPNGGKNSNGGFDIKNLAGKDLQKLLAMKLAK